jgi:formiminotetrahydrofolate cyclodeaminase
MVSAVGAMAASLCSMVAGMSRGKKNYLAYDRELGEALERLAQLREELKAAVDADAASYTAVVKAFKEARASGNGKEAVDRALKGATLVPLGVVERAHEVAEWAEKLRPVTNPRMASDLTTAVSMARAAIEGAMANVEINLGSLSDEAFRSEIQTRLGRLGMR